MKLTERQTEIIDTALKLTAQGGIQNLTVKNLACALGISEPAIYRHFLNKSEIIKAMIRNFESEAYIEIRKKDRTGLAGVEEFVKSRFALVAANPPLAKVMFAEELFMDDPQYSDLMTGMMHKHKLMLQKMFEEAQKVGEIRKDIEIDMLFRLVFGPVRLLIKQWGMSNHAFELIHEGNLLWKALKKTLH